MVVGWTSTKVIQIILIGWKHGCQGLKKVGFGFFYAVFYECLVWIYVLSPKGMGTYCFGMDSVGVSIEVAFCLHSNLLSYMYGRSQTILWKPSCGFLVKQYQFRSAGIWWSLLNRINNFLFTCQIHMSRDMRFPTMWYIRPAKAKTSLRIRTVWSEPLLVAWLFDIGIKHGFLCINICWTLRVVLKPEPKKPGI